MGRRSFGDVYPQALAFGMKIEREAGLSHSTEKSQDLLLCLFNRAVLIPSGPVEPSAGRSSSCFPVRAEQGPGNLLQNYYQELLPEFNNSAIIFISIYQIIELTHNYVFKLPSDHFLEKDKRSYITAEANYQLTKARFE